jgi:hypothetical protein
MKKEELKQLIREAVREEFYYHMNNNWFAHDEDTDAFELRLLINEMKFNMKDTYDIKLAQKHAIEFVDEYNITHITKITPNAGYMEVKLYWLDPNNNLKPSMSEPPKSGTKTLNTHINNLINIFLPKYDKFLIRPNDPIRYRLFQLILHKFIDKNVWDIQEFQGSMLITKRRSK